MAGRKSYKGTFSPVNRSKYRGNINDIVWRSSWELKFMNALDLNPNVVEWSSELPIPYISPLDDKMHRYFVDFYVGFKKIDGSVHKMLVEVKPKYQTAPPKPKKRMSPTLLNEMRTWEVNQAKWAAAKRLCDDLGWEWKIATEEHLEIK